MTPIQYRIKEIQENGYQLDFGTVFESAFENYKKIALYAGLMLIVFSFLFGVVLVAILISIFGIDAVTEALKPENLNAEALKGDFLILYTASVVLITCIISPFQAGFLKMAECGQKDEEFHVSTIFEYYKSPYFLSIFTATFIISVLSATLSLLFELSGIAILGTIANMIISFFTLFTIPLIIFGKMNTIEAIKSSVIIFSKQPGLIIGLTIVAGFASIVGLIGLCIGIFFTIPFVYSMSYKLYYSIIGNETIN